MANSEGAWGRLAHQIPRHILPARVAEVDILYRPQSLAEASLTCAT